MTKAELFTLIGLDAHADRHLTFNEIYSAYSYFRKNDSVIPDKEKFPYPAEGTILDEDQTVRWNREEVERLRKAYKNESNRLRKLHNMYDKTFEEVLITMACDATIDHELNEKQIKLCFDAAYERGHAYGYHEIYSVLTDILLFAVNIIAATNE